MTATSPQQPFDARAAQEELERLRLEIGATRRRREQLVADFEAFLRNTRAALETHARPAVSGDTGRAADAVDGGRAHSGGGPGRTPALAERPAIDFGVFDDPDQTARVADPIDLIQRIRKLGWKGVAGVVAIGIFLSVWAFRGGGDNATAVQPARESDASVPTAGSPAAAAGATGTSQEVPAEARAVRVELVTTDEVWLRVQVDGQRVVERELPAGQRLRYAADREIVVRTGNAGALRIKVGDGAEQALGRTGEVVTRTFSAASKS